MIRQVTRLAILFFIAALLNASIYSQQAVREIPPNIIVILADDLGYGDLSAYGAKDVSTPQIDKLIAGGMRLNAFYANSTVCSPSRAALLTGRYPDMVGVPGVIRTDPRNSWGYLSNQVELLPQKLKRIGYHTALIGKWHLGLSSPNTPNERGFDYFHGFLGDMMDDYYTHLRDGRNFMRLNDREINPEGHATDLFTDWASDYVTERARDKRPFFLYLAYNAPHVPVQPPAAWLEKVKKREPQLNDKRARLVALIEHLDDSIGRLRETLKANGQEQNTLVIFTSDNGGQLSAGANNGPWRGGKEQFYEGGIRVPFAAFWPGQIPAGTVSEETALIMDIFPTVCAAAHASPGETDGISLLPLLQDDHHTTLPERTLFWVRREGGAPYYGKDYYAVRRGPWKLVQNNPFEPFKLFNLMDDSHEDRDVSSVNRKVYDELTNTLQEHLQKAGTVPWQR